MASMVKTTFVVVGIIAVVLLLLQMVALQSSPITANDGAAQSKAGFDSDAQRREITLRNELQAARAELEAVKQENAQLRGSAQQPQQPAQQAKNPFADGSKKTPFDGPAAANNPFLDGAAPAVVAPTVAQPAAVAVQQPAAQKLQLADAGRSAVLLICYNRPRYLQRAFEAIIKAFPKNPADRPSIYISQDGNHQGVAQTVQAFIAKAAGLFPGTEVLHLRHPQEGKRGDDQQGYMKLARHFGWALGQVFDVHKAPRVIVLEDDLEVAIDFFDYFKAVAPLLDNDDTLLAASAWNDLGQAQFVNNPEIVYRSDFFPGLGWMINARVWNELRPKWPNGYWDDWLREPPQRRGRATLHPEVSRTYTFGEQGVSQSQFFNQYLKTIKLNNVVVNWASKDMSQLTKAVYDPQMRAAVHAAQPANFHSLPASCSASAPAYKLTYRGTDHGAQAYTVVARPFGFMVDIKAGIPRTAYMGVVSIWYHGCRVFIAPTDFQ